MKDLRVIISMMVKCNAMLLLLLLYDSRGSGLLNAPQDMDYGNNITEE